MSPGAEGRRAGQSRACRLGGRTASWAARGPCAAAIRRSNSSTIGRGPCGRVTSHCGKLLEAELRSFQFAQAGRRCFFEGVRRPGFIRDADAGNHRAVPCCPTPLALARSRRNSCPRSTYSGAMAGRPSPLPRKSGGCPRSQPSRSRAHSEGAGRYHVPSRWRSSSPKRSLSLRNILGLVSGAWPFFGVRPRSSFSRPRRGGSITRLWHRSAGPRRRFFGSSSLSLPSARSRASAR